MTGILPLVRLFACVLGFAALCVLPLRAQAERVAVVLSSDTAAYQEVYQVARVMLESNGYTLDRQYAAALSPQAIANVRVVLAVGVAAAEAVADLPNRTPVLAVLVPSTWYRKTGRARLSEGGRLASAIFLDQPFARQAKLIRLVFPELRRVGVVLSAEQRDLVADIEAALRPWKLELVHAILDEDARLSTVLEAVLPESGLLLAVPDGRVFNAYTAQSILLTSYRYRDPVVGYSRSLTRAGALLSLYASPAQVSRQACEWLSAALDGPTLRLPEADYPAYYSVSVNEQVARSLGFVVPPEKEIEKRLGGEP